MSILSGVTSNGNGSVSAAEPSNSAEAEKVLVGAPMTLSYRPQLPYWSWQQYNLGYAFAMMWMDIEAMLMHPHLSHVYDIYKAGIHHAEHKVVANSPEIQRFVEIMLRRFWERSLEQAQLHYDYGWDGFEVCYGLEKGYLTYSHIYEFSPFDCWALTKNNHYVGVKVQNVMDAAAGGGSLSLWGPHRWPAKALWLTHNRRFNRWYGRSAVIRAHRPWRRLAIKDAAEEVVDGAFYRFGYRGPVIRYPVKAYPKRGTSGETTDQTDFEASRENARQMAEQIKAGMSIALPGSRDAKGEYEWMLENMDPHNINLAPTLEYLKYLNSEIGFGIGVPPELTEAADVGSGWSGRKVPLLVFYTQMLKNARSMTWAFMRQILVPLVHWNFGPKGKFEVEVEVSMPKALDQQQQQQQPGEGTPPGGAPGAVPPGAGPPKPPAPPPGGQPKPPAPGGPPKSNGAMLATLPFDLWEVAPPPAEPIQPEFDWLSIVLNGSPHSLILGPTSSGKTTVAQVIAAAALKIGKILLIDPLWTPETWGGLPAATMSDDGSFAPIENTLLGLRDEANRRQAMVKKSHQQYERLTVIWDEVPNSVQQIDERKESKNKGLVGDLIRRLGNYGRHFNMHLVMLSQSRRVEAFGLSGSGDTLTNFSVIYLGTAATDRDPSLKGTDHPAVIDWLDRVYPFDMSQVRQAGEVDAQKILAENPDSIFKLPGLDSFGNKVENSDGEPLPAPSAMSDDEIRTELAKEGVS